MTNLVIVMAGDNSLHERYANDRDFELWVCYFGDDEGVAARYEGGCDRFFRLKGQKWELVREIGRMARQNDLPSFASYGFVFLPDDDIEFPEGAAAISRAFVLANEIGADIFQPAIANEYYSWEATRRAEGAFCHATMTVEIMMPAYSGEIFERCVLPLLHTLVYIRAGWGIEPLIARLSENTLDRPVRTFVLDDVPAIHTRPVGKGTAAYDLGKDEAYLNPLVPGLWMQELAQFQSPREAASYVFPASDERISWRAVEKHLGRIKGARNLHEAARRKNVAGYLLSFLQKLSGNRPGD